MRRFKCPHCGDKIKASPDWRQSGRITCWSCNRSFIVEEDRKNGFTLAFQYTLLSVVLASWLLGGIGTILLLIGDPEVKIQPRTRAGMPLGKPFTPSFPARFLAASLLVAGLGVVGRRALSQEGDESKFLNLVGLLLFVLIVCAWMFLTRPMAAFLQALLLLLPLLGLVYAELLTSLASTILATRHGNVTPTPPWMLQGFCILMLLFMVFLPALKFLSH